MQKSLCENKEEEYYLPHNAVQPVSLNSILMIGPKIQEYPIQFL